MSYSQTCLCGNTSQYRKIFSGKHKRSVSGQKKTKFKFTIIQCKNCDLTQTFPRPYESSLETDLYQETRDVDDRVRRKDTFIGYAKHILDHIREFKPTGTLVDVGCAIGALVYEAKQQSYTAIGIEINPYAIQKSKELFQVPILEENIYKTSLPKNHADIVVINQTLEHIEDPVSFLKTIKGFLKEDGILYITVPNFAGYMVQFKRTQWGGLDPMRHLWQFTPNTLSQILNQAGFTIKKFILNENIDHFGYELSRDLWPIRKFKEYLISRSIQLNRGDNLVCIAEQSHGNN